LVLRQFQVCKPAIPLVLALTWAGMGTFSLHITSQLDITLRLLFTIASLYITAGQSLITTRHRAIMAMRHQLCLLATTIMAAIIIIVIKVATMGIIMAIMTVVMVAGNVVEMIAAVMVITTAITAVIAN
jgi:hypothetical protein